mmetsp:Transcript_30364/g.84892  ORF Transcript_30364/g.84892 Transcript_30364/m.84892 type:complete len:211 (-) Transcript_30364:6655-7287(-)
MRGGQQAEMLHDITSPSVNVIAVPMLPQDGDHVAQQALGDALNSPEQVLHLEFAGPLACPQLGGCAPRFLGSPLGRLPHVCSLGLPPLPFSAVLLAFRARGAQGRLFHLRRQVRSLLGPLLKLQQGAALLAEDNQKVQRPFKVGGALLADLRCQEGKQHLQRRDALPPARILPHSPLPLSPLGCSGLLSLEHVPEEHDRDIVVVFAQVRQ